MNVISLFFKPFTRTVWMAFMFVVLQGWLVYWLYQARAIQPIFGPGKEARRRKRGGNHMILK